MCRGGRTDLLLLQMAVRSVKSVSSSESEVMSWFWPISPVSTSRSLWQFNRILQNVSSESCNRLSNSLTVPFSISQKMLLFLQVVSAPSPDVLEEMNSRPWQHNLCQIYHFLLFHLKWIKEKKLDLLLMAYIPVCGQGRMSRSLPFPYLSSGAAFKSLVLLLEAGAEN